MLAGCGGGSGSLIGLPVAGAGTGGSALGNLAQYGTTTPPPVLAVPDEEVVCPPVSIEAGGAAIRLQSGGSSEGVRSQVSITDVARECAAGPGGSVIVRVGAEGRSLIGPAGSPGAHFATMRITVRRGDAVVASRTARVGANVPAGQGQAPWVHVEQGISIPANVLASRGDVDIFVSLSPGGAEPRRRR
jgi:hypothetical protein